MTINTPISEEDPFPLAPPAVVDYAASYRRLQEIVDRLKRGGPGDIDTLVESFRAGVAAYEACKGRLDAIRAEIDSEIARLAPPAAFS
jgi:exodeoxyribonuclease VII small subunit